MACQRLSAWINSDIRWFKSSPHRGAQVDEHCTTIEEECSSYGRRSSAWCDLQPSVGTVDGQSPAWAPPAGVTGCTRVKVDCDEKRGQVPNKKYKRKQQLYWPQRVHWMNSRPIENSLFRCECEWAVLGVMDYMYSDYWNQVFLSSVVVFLLKYFTIKYQVHYISKWICYWVQTTRWYHSRLKFALLNLYMFKKWLCLFQVITNIMHHPASTLVTHHTHPIVV